TWLVWLPVEHCRASQRSLQETNEFEQWHRVGASQVENFVGARCRLPLLEPSPGAHNALYDIIHVGVIPLRSPITKDRDRLPCGYEPGKLVDGKIGTLIGTIHRKKAQAGHTQTIQMRVSITEQLTGAFGGSVGRHRRTDVIVLSKGHALPRSIDGRRRAKEE